jgi:predicted RNase H-like nuclease
MLFIGFDSAWSENNSGAIVGVLRKDDGSYLHLGDPQKANFDKATTIIEEWKEKYKPVTTLILIDQPIIVKNEAGQRPVENIVSSSVSKRYGGVQPANRGRVEMFGNDAPIWGFMNNFGGPSDPMKNQLPTNCVIETYPVLALIAVGWLLNDDHPNPRATGRLPKYNPERETFSIDDWKFVCDKIVGSFNEIDLSPLVEWLEKARDDPSPQKPLQDCLDACLCLLVGIHLVEKNNCLFVGNMETGYMVVPYGETLHKELDVRCRETESDPAKWIWKFKIS